MTFSDSSDMSEAPVVSTGGANSVLEDFFCSNLFPRWVS